MLYELVSDLIGYTGTNVSYSSIVNICGALIILFWIMLFYFIYRIIFNLFFR